ncbi:uncharacterized protein LOC128548470 [Mercenaria mercenaria]|uniref:uncharacterized protein LOC128548470 n=1 Tax=Mercenaria mercenaria TaxID=6596 RepID=UPI00234E5417|nr:uncharacterized protein LOC128548470 [Mercenaria mercenaria]
MERITHFRQMCKSMKLETNNRGTMTMQFHFSKEYNLAYKPVPKICSTFMIQVFKLLLKKETEEVFKVPRKHVHDGRGKKTISLDALDNQTVLIMARNPYSRLFSAYIDKVYLLNNIHLNLDIYSKIHRIQGNSSVNYKCKFNVTFDQFLEYVFNERWRQIDKGHYAPVLPLSMCQKICNLRNIIIVKQETFSEDLEHALKSVGVKGKVYNVIYDEMHSKHAKSTTAGIVRTLYEKMSELLSKHKYLNWQIIAERLWNSFQIQGYIHENSTFPYMRYNHTGKYANSEYLIKLIMEEIEQKPLNHKEKVNQRNKALLHAYSDVRVKYLRQIQEHYTRDFEMFHYSNDLESFSKM